MQKFILMDNPSRLYTVIQENLPAANGIIHIIDRPITNTPSDRPPRDDQVSLPNMEIYLEKKLQH